MKKRLLATALVLVVIIFIAGILYYTSYPSISVMKTVGVSSDNFEKEFHSESLSISAAVIDFLPDSPRQKRKTDEIQAWNNPISLELAEYRKAGGSAYNIELSGEIKDGKTTLRYEGYIITKSGERINYEQEKTFDFVICPEKNFSI